jgi:UDP-N-acetylglucosamine--N-acetylmuramyl-(pentapeptide) pyrophosphoryl-undecaprenol N-acetylglucosamine transferase
MNVIIAAAGTAGHINPGIAIANKIKQEEKDSKIIFLGTTRGLENDLVPKAGYELKTIDAYGLSKELSVANIKKIYKTFKGIGEAKKIVKEFKPDIVIGAGGYICGAATLAANKYNVPVVLHESNAFPGKAVKMLAKKVDEILISFKDAEQRIKNAKKIVHTGTPVKILKKEYSMNEKKEIIKTIGLTEIKPIVLIFGGSQGAQKINEAVIEILTKNLNKNYQVIWATGPKQYEMIEKTLKNKNLDIENIPNAKIVPYIYNMEEIMNVSNVIVARSGAMTIAEISNLGKPSILIPLPNVSQDHQLYNAKVLEKVGAAQIILNNELTKENLNETINSIVTDANKMKTMGENALKEAAYDVEDRIYKEVKYIVNNKKNN